MTLLVDALATDATTSRPCGVRSVAARWHGLRGTRKAVSVASMAVTLADWRLCCHTGQDQRCSQVLAVCPWHEAPLANTTCKHPQARSRRPSKTVTSTIPHWQTSFIWTACLCASTVPAGAHGFGNSLATPRAVCSSWRPATVHGTTQCSYDAGCRLCL